MLSGNQEFNGWTRNLGNIRVADADGRTFLWTGGGTTLTALVPPEGVANGGVTLGTSSTGACMDGSVGDTPVAMVR